MRKKPAKLLLLAISIMTIIALCACSAKESASSNETDEEAMVATDYGKAHFEVPESWLDNQEKADGTVYYHQENGEASIFVVERTTEAKRYSVDDAKDLYEHDISTLSEKDGFKTNNVELSTEDDYPFGYSYDYIWNDPDGVQCTGHRKVVFNGANIYELGCETAVGNLDYYSDVLNASIESFSVDYSSPAGESDADAKTAAKEKADNYKKGSSDQSGGKDDALSSAKSYLDTMPFSYSGLIEQLEFDGFTNEEATYAADNCGADWNEQAVRDAELYLDAMEFSYSDLKDQLLYEGYTESEATYAVDNCRADWNE